jgi:hypothetical protein
LSSLSGLSNLPSPGSITIPPLCLALSMN